MDPKIHEGGPVLINVGQATKKEKKKKKKFETHSPAPIDDVVFYFHGHKDKAYCLLSDSEIHINAHFISKRSKIEGDLTRVRSVKI